MVKDANVLSEHVMEEPLVLHAVAHLAGHESESAMPHIASPYMPSTCTLVTTAVVHWDGLHVKDA